MSDNADRVSPRRRLRYHASTVTLIFAGAVIALHRSSPIRPIVLQFRELPIAKNQNTYAKRQREQEKKQRADIKRAKRDKKKGGTESTTPSVREYHFPAEDRSE